MSALIGYLHDAEVGVDDYGKEHVQENKEDEEHKEEEEQRTEDRIAIVHETHVEVAQEDTK